MADVKLSDEDVIALVRKEFERKLKDFCADNGYTDPGHKSDKPDETKDEDSKDGDEESNDDRNKEKSKKPKHLEAQDLAPGIRVRHRDSQLVYTVDNLHLGTGRVDLETPEGSLFSVPAIQIEKEYELD